LEEVVKFHATNCMSAGTSVVTNILAYMRAPPEPRQKAQAEGIQ
jgi:hypothetical protein